MNKFYILILLISITSCKKATNLDLENIINSEPTDKEGEVFNIDPLLFASFDNKQLKDFYNLRDNETVWQSENNRKIIIEAISNCENQGLRPTDYNISELKKFENSYLDLEESELINYDLQLTYNLQKYLIHLRNGKLNPKTLYSNWELKIDTIDTKTILNRAIEEDSLKTEIINAQPQALTYKSLIKALNIINEFPEDKTPTIVFDEKKITKNQTNNSIINIKKRLIYWKDLKTKDSITAIYDTATFKAVKRFQTRHGLISDGIIGKSTINALNFTKENRKQQIIANLERWRWYSKPFAENYLLINIPNYRLTVVEKQNIKINKRIVVGKIKRQTPILTSVLQTVVFNPTWTVPPTILKEDLIPEMEKNRMAMKNKGIGIYDNKNNEVDPLKWDEKRPRGYRYIQKPGYYNSLGVVKINFPNHFSVYLHDTNHRELFDRHFRSLSSGCVRIEKPLELIEILLDNPKKYSQTKMDSIIATKETLFIGITKRYAIYQWYWTAWSENNDLVFCEDIYNLDTDLYKKLRD
jgi:murein L,D-transpeptidase YcbB/YkuD